MAKKKIEKQYSLLYRVPKSAIVDFLLEQDEEAVKAALKKLKLPVSGSLLSNLTNLQYRNVVAVFQECSGTTKSDAKALFEQYRYRGMKSLYLYRCNNLDNLQNLNKDTLTIIISQRAEAYHAEQSQRFSNLKVRDIEKLGSGTFLEIYYSYHAPVQIISPKTEYPELVSDMRGGFIWLNRQHLWMCVSAKDESINHILTESLQEHLKFEARRLPLTKTVQQRLEDDEYIRKAGFLNPLTGTRRRITNPDMRSDPEAMQEFRARDGHDDRPLSAFNVTLDDGTTFAVSYNEMGKIYFSRDLTVSQMREWGPQKIQRIVEIINELSLDNPAALLGESISSLRGVSMQSKKAILEIASAVTKCKQQNVSDIPLNSSALELTSALKSKINPVFRTYCHSCDDITEVHCPACQSGILDIKVNEIVCKNCSAVMDTRVTCIEGHHISITGVTDIIQLLPSPNLCETIRNMVYEATGDRLSTKEYFYIKGNRLFFSSVSRKTVFFMEELPELNILIEQQMPTTSMRTIRESLNEFKERCPKMSDQNCSQCVNRRIEPKCFLRLFGLFDDSYTPRPHQGHEYGDYSTRVTIDGIPQKQLTIAMKSYKGQRKVTARSKLGQDIYSQVMGYLHDGTIDIVGICLPGKLEESFASELVHDARLNQKKLLFINDDDLVKITYSAMRRSNIRLNDI